MIFQIGISRYKLVFRYNDRATYAALLFDEQFNGPRWVELLKTKATRAPQDQDERAMGRLIALERLVAAIPSKELRQAVNRCFYRNCSLPTRSSLRAYRLEQRQAKWRQDAEAS